MAAKFGTSGLRGLVIELTSQCVADHVRAFDSTCYTGRRLCMGRDLRPSCLGIAADVIADVRAAFLASLGGQEAGTDLTDGLRISLQGGSVVHLRHSSNAPEFRLYVEAADQEGVQPLLTAGLARFGEALCSLRAASTQTIAGSEGSGSALRSQQGL